MLTRTSTIAVTLVALSGLGFVDQAAGQTAYRAASGQTSINAPRSGFFSFDFAEVKFGLTFLWRRPGDCDGANCNPNELIFSGHVSGAARGEEKTIFAGLNFVPRYDFAAQLSYLIPHGASSYHLWFASAGVSAVERNFVLIDAINDVGILLEEIQNTVFARVGFNYAFNDVTVIGFAFEGRRELESPGTQSPFEICTSGRNGVGIQVQVCRDRFVGPLTNIWSGTARADLNLKIATLGSRVRSPRLGIIAAGSANIEEQASPWANLAIGPSLHLANYPGVPVVAILFGLQDAFKANSSRVIIQQGQAPRGGYFEDHALFQLLISVPFGVFLTNP